VNCNRQRVFRFELPWLKDEECLNRIQKIWSKPTRDIVAINRVQFKLKKGQEFPQMDGDIINMARPGKGRRKLLMSLCIWKYWRKVATS
jgi:hypothetical protein